MTGPVSKDPELLDLEARWRATGSVDDEARYLRWRVYAGDLLEVRLDLAAYLGHPGAVAALEAAPPPVDDLEVWVLGIFEPRDPRSRLPSRKALNAPQRAKERPDPLAETLVAPSLPLRHLILPATSAAARLVAPRIETTELSGTKKKETKRLRSTVKEVLSWLESDRPWDVGWLCYSGGTDVLLRLRNAPPADEVSRTMASALRCLAWVVQVIQRREGMTGTGPEAREELALAGCDVARVAALAAQATGDEQGVRDAIRDALVPIVLGQHEWFL